MWVHVCVGVCMHMCMCVYALRTVSVHKILCFTKPFYYYHLSLEITPISLRQLVLSLKKKKKEERCNFRNQFMNQAQHCFRFSVCIAFPCTVVSQDSIPKASA